MDINVNPMNPSAPDMTSSASDLVDTMNEPKQVAPKVDPKTKKRNGDLRTSVELCKTYRRKLIPNWSVSIDYRRGKPYTTQSDSDQIAVNLDWSLTKVKQASLFSQVPQVRVNHGEDLLPKTAPWSIAFQKKLNDVIRKAGIESAMEECLPDCINAAGIGVVLVSYHALTEDIQIPSTDLSTLPPELQQEAMMKGTIGGQEIEMETVPRTTDTKYEITRVSPADFLWPVNFIGSDFDNAPWVGRTGRLTWAEAKRNFNLTDEDKTTIFGEDQRSTDKLSSDIDRDRDANDDVVSFDEVFYKEYQYDEDAKSYTAIHHVVFVHGKEDPVIDEPWKGQHIDEESGEVLGVQKFPVRVLTLAYLTDEAIPPSDSAIGRPQVDEINKSRTQMILQRERSLPLRWADINRLDPTIMQGMMRGRLQNIIPVQGDGSRILGEIAKSNFPPENFKFDQIAKADLNQEWLDPQLSGADVETKGESNNIAASAQLPRTRERAQVSSFFVEIAEVLGGLICLYEDPQSFGQGFDPKFSKLLDLSILADSTVLLDSNQRLQRLTQFVNEFAKSGFINIEPVLAEIATLNGLDPTVVITPPHPKPPAEPNISLRLTGVEDLMNPLTLAFLMKSGQAPDEKMIEDAKKLIQSSVTPPEGLQLQPGMPGPGQAPMLPQGPAPAGPAGPPPGGPVAPPTPPPTPVGEAHPQWTAMTKLNKRTDGGRQ
jgi:hypothetical protein